MSQDIEKTRANLPLQIKNLCVEFGSKPDTMMKQERLEYLAASLICSPILPDDFLIEIGTYIGMTSVFMSKVLDYYDKKNPIVSVDCFERFEIGSTVIGNYTIYMQNIKKYDLINQCFVISAFSYQAAPIIKNDIPFILIDGGHYYKAVKSDLELYLPKLKIGGIAYIDDNIKKIYPAISQAISESIYGNDSYEILVDSTYFIVQRKK